MTAAGHSLPDTSALREKQQPCPCSAFTRKRERVNARGASGGRQRAAVAA